MFVKKLRLENEKKKNSRLQDTTSLLSSLFS